MNKRLKKWFVENFPEALDVLNEPAKMSEITVLEKQLGIKFPEAMKALYLCHNGQIDGAKMGFFYGQSFLSLKGIEEHWQEWREIAQEPQSDYSEYQKSHVKETIKEVYANEKWIPFTHDYAGNHLGLDFDPGQNGTMGQIINFGRQENEKFVIASSFDEFIQWYINQLESGNFCIKQEDDYISFNTKKPDSQHFLDAVKILFEEPDDVMHMDWSHHTIH